MEITRNEQIAVKMYIPYEQMIKIKKFLKFWQLLKHRLFSSWGMNSIIVGQTTLLLSHSYFLDLICFDCLFVPHYDLLNTHIACTYICIEESKNNLTFLLSVCSLFCILLRHVIITPLCSSWLCVAHNSVSLVQPLVSNNNPYLLTSSLC